MNEHERAARYADLHEHRLQLLGEITEAQACFSTTAKLTASWSRAQRLSRAE